MEYCFLKGFILVLTIQHCTSEGFSTFLQSSTMVTLQESQTSSQEPPLPRAEVVPLLAAPSLEEVQQIVQEASQQVDGRGAEEVLKELLERVVEAALVQVDGGGEVKTDGVEEQEKVEAEAMETEMGGPETDTEAKVEQAVTKGPMAEDMSITGADTGVEEHDVSEMNAFKVVAEEGKGLEGQIETAAEEANEEAGVKPGGAEAEEMMTLDDSLDARVSHEFVEKIKLEETEEYEAKEEADMENTQGQVELIEENEAAETDLQVTEEIPAIVGVAASSDSEEETVVETDVSLSAVDMEQTEDLWEKDESLKEETQVDEKEGEVNAPSSDNYKMEITQTVKRQPVEQEDIFIKTNSEGREEEQGHLVEGGTVGEVQGERLVGGAAEGKIHEENVNNEDSVALVSNGFGDEQNGAEEQIAGETFNISEKEDEEVPVISAPEPDDSTDAPIERRPGNQTPSTSPSQVGVEANKNTLGNENTTSTNDLLQHDLVVAQPTLENFGQDELPEGEDPGEASEMAENIAVNIEKSELGLETWKIGAISASVLLVLETIVIIIYFLKCSKNGTPSLQKTCEEGCVEPEATTGGDCSDETLPAGNWDTQQIAKLDTCDVASTLNQTKDQHEGECVTVMSDLLPSSTEQSPDSGPEPDSSQDLRTSIL